jgi:hypothetical protein
VFLGNFNDLLIPSTAAAFWASPAWVLSVAHLRALALKALGPAQPQSERLKAFLDHFTKTT